MTESQPTAEDKMPAQPPGRTEGLDLEDLASNGARQLGSIVGPGATESEATAQEVIEWVARTFDHRKVAVACSMADAVLPHAVSQAIPGVDVLFLDTGYHFMETHLTKAMVEDQLDVRIVEALPEQTVAEQNEAHGRDLFARDPALCCQLRKVDPLNRTLAGYDVWFTGVRRDEAPTRSNTPLVTFDHAHGMVKVNPLAAWSMEDLLDYVGEHSTATSTVPVNQLLSQGYPSIGCKPCTKKVAPGDDPRSGRWAGSDKTECGIHV